VSTIDKVDQTTFGFPGGNCFSACVASLLRIPLGDVPYFMDAEDWFDAFDKWLRQFRLYPLRFEKYTPPGYSIMSGTSPRAAKPDDLHSVVAFCGEVAHDPHPSRDGVLSLADHIVLVPVLPTTRLP
jgi:hypothetical protein